MVFKEGHRHAGAAGRARTTGLVMRTSLLLVSGYWGTSRHFHYLPEILGSIFWSIPAGFNHFMPHFYYVFLTILLVDRAFRDEARCANKYGKYYDEYKRQVPYKIIPGVL